jgi:acetate CoA/acetoacetate CoA-transferase beta subunit
MDKKKMRNLIARRVAQELNTGDLINLGIGMPTLVAGFVDPEKHVVFCRISIRK